MSIHIVADIFPDPDNFLREILKVEIIRFTSKLFYFTVKRLFMGLKEISGKHTARFKSVSDFWFAGVDRRAVGKGDIVELTGIVSVLVPYTPSHPRLKPAFNVHTWEALNKLHKDIRNKAHLDILIWGDTVINPNKSINNKVLLGIYDEYGEAWRSLLGIIDFNNSRHKAFYEELKGKRGVLAKVKGRIIPLPSYVTQFGVKTQLGAQRENSSDNLDYMDIQEQDIQNNAALEIYEIKTFANSKNVLFAPSWCALKTGETLSYYVDVFSEQISQANYLLQKRYLKEPQLVEFIYDTSIVKDLPVYNKYLLELLRNID